MTLELSVAVEQWPVRRPFRIAYHTFHHRDLLRVQLHDGTHSGRGEAGGHPHLEPIEHARQRLLDLEDEISVGMTRTQALEMLPAGPARNALDCALWDLEAKRLGCRVWQLAGLPAPRGVETAYTVGIASTEEMVADALQHRHFRLLKLKVDSASGFEALQVIAEVRPDASFIIDANEAWSMGLLEEFTARVKGLRVTLIEQPLPRHADEALAGFRSPIPLAADESFHVAADLEHLRGRYQVVNIKLDKIGGLTAALEAARQAHSAGLELMVGCNGGTSLGIAPAYCLALVCRHVDLDSPLLLARDREPALSYRDGFVQAPVPFLWG